MSVRTVQQQDVPEWLRMRHLLWPLSESETQRNTDSHAKDIADFWNRCNPSLHRAFVYERSLQNDLPALGGFLELSLRVYVPGASVSPTPFVEGWFVDADLRRQGIGAQLIALAQSWCVSQSYTELGSDVEQDNAGSLKVHESLGFSEIERVVCLLKRF